ncbi:MAG: TRAP transporter small permease subunit [Caldimonas sp.]
MDVLLRLTRGIDRLNRFVGRAMLWPLLASVLISAGNAISRKFFSLSSNGWLEIQWHLFAVAFLGCAGYVLLVDEHVRVDALSRRFTARTRAVVDAVALAFVALPMTVVFAARRETSQDGSARRSPSSRARRLM